MIRNYPSLVEEYLNYCRFQKNLATKTQSAYAADLRQFFENMGTEEDAFNKSTILKYMELLHSKYKPKTVKRKIASLKAFANYLGEEELIDKNPFDKLKIKYKEALTLPKTIPVDHLQRILNTMYRELQKPTTVFAHAQLVRDIAILELLFATGVRVSELCTLTLSNINLKARYTKVIGKGAKERILQIENREVLSALKSYVMLRSAFIPVNEDMLYN